VRLHPRQPATRHTLYRCDIKPWGAIVSASHKTLRGFSTRYGTYRLVRYEIFEDMANAIKREKQLKNWHRDWKINLIERENPYWDDLAIGLGFDPLPPYTKPSP
jgi:hypothetical protein